MKTCKLCHKEKQDSDFNKSKSGKNGIASWCRKCAGEKSKARYGSDYTNKTNLLTWEPPKGA